jgi:hypothetical protein
VLNQIAPAERAPEDEEEDEFERNWWHPRPAEVDGQPG